MDQVSSAQAASAIATVSLEVRGMKCAGCVQGVEKQLYQQPGVLRASVNLVTQLATVDYQVGRAAPSEWAAQLTAAGFPTQVQVETPTRSQAIALSQAMEQRQELMSHIRQLILAVLLVVVSGLGHLSQMQGWQIPALGTIWFHGGLATLALIGPGRAMLIDGWQGLRRGTPNMNTLVGLGTLTAYTASLVALFWPALHWECFFDEPVMIVGLILLGRTLEQQARRQATASFQALLSLQPAIARFLSEPNPSAPYREIPVEQVQVGAWLQVLPGDKFPVDGKILAGETLVDEAMLTGEPLPVLKAPGDPVMAGTLNQSTAVTIQATRTGKETVLAQIIRMVETAQTRKAPVQRLADQVAGYFTYGVMTIAVLTFGFWELVGTRLWPEVLSHSISMFGHSAMITPQPTSPLLLSLKLAIAVLVVACPCALGLATPTAILVGTSLGAEKGLLIRGGDVLEQVQRLDTIVFDKTGTLTQGHPTVTDCWLHEAAPLELTPDRLLQIAATVESGVRHPLAEAILAQAQLRGLPLLAATDFQTQPGWGVSAQVEGQRVVLGTRNWLQQQGIQLGAIAADPQADPTTALTAAGKSLVYVAIAGEFAGVIAAQDQLRPDAISTLKALQAMGLQILVLTGDHPQTTAAVLQPLNLPPTQILAGIHPDQKASVIAQLQATGQRVGMVGDGINDAPALAQADIGIALSSGTDVAIETAQIVLMPKGTRGGESSLIDVVAAIRLSRATYRKIQQNLFWAFAYNTLGIPLAAGCLLPIWGILLNPAAAGALMACSSVSVVTNSLLLRRHS